MTPNNFYENTRIFSIGEGALSTETLAWAIATSETESAACSRVVFFRGQIDQNLILRIKAALDEDAQRFWDLAFETCTTGIQGRETLGAWVEASNACEDLLLEHGDLVEMEDVSADMGEELVALNMDFARLFQEHLSNLGPVRPFIHLVNHTYPPTSTEVTQQVELLGLPEFHPAR